jgi:hypothetical protein
LSKCWRCPPFIFRLHFCCNHQFLGFFRYLLDNLVIDLIPKMSQILWR